jgi:cytochrome c oxidase assembly protein subunit 15
MFLFFTPVTPSTMASLGSSLPLWRSVAPRLAKNAFTCRQCLWNQGYAAKSIRQFGSIPACKPSKIQSALLNDKNRQFFTSSIKRSTATPSVTEAIEEGAAKTKSSFPKISDKAVAYWLLGSAASVFGIVVFGGLTRLTESGYVGVPCLLANQAPDANGTNFGID